MMIGIISAHSNKAMITRRAFVKLVTKVWSLCEITVYRMNSAFYRVLLSVDYASLPIESVPIAVKIAVKPVLSHASLHHVSEAAL